VGKSAGHLKQIFVLDIACIAIGATITACATYFLEVCMRKGMIFEKYYDWLVMYHAKFHEDYENAIFNNDLDRIEELAEKSFWFKPMGGCSTCMNVWICFFTFPMTMFYFDVVFSWWSILLFFSYVFISNSFLRKFLNE